MLQNISKYLKTFPKYANIYQRKYFKTNCCVDDTKFQGLYNGLYAQIPRIKIYLTKFDKSWQLDKSWQKLTKVVKTWQNLTRVDKSCQKLTKLDKTWQKLTKVDRSWQKLTKVDKSWQKLTISQSWQFDKTFLHARQLAPTWQNLGLN